MRLRRVKIFGFKTFAEKAEVEISGDFVAVVGPNGSGKSNIVDAILWGLGEGNSRHLRAQSGTDVIFNGSSKRKAVGYAEVSLLFDNEDGALPIPTSEVTVTRKLTRAGESEYSINRQTCRLRDVLELLADSGLGRAGYSIVGQKEIDSALAASVEDRRSWVDEAAGVQRYRSRKVESLRRLASAKDHLSRVKDILREIESQRDPLAAEAEVAIRYKSALSSLREIESGLLIVEIANAKSEIEKQEDVLANCSSTLRKESEMAIRAEDEISRIGSKISTLESDLDSLRASLQSTLTQYERLESTIQLGNQKLASFESLEANFEDETAQAKLRILEMEAEIAALELEEEREIADCKRISEETVGVSEKASELKIQLQNAESALESGRKTYNLKLQLEAEERQQASRKRELKRELESAQSSVQDVETAAEEANGQLQQAKVVQETAEAELTSAKKELNSSQRELQTRAAELREILAHRASLEGRKRGIEATIDAHEGLAQGPKAVLEAVERGAISGEFIPVGEAISVPKELALAVETALGATANDLICNTDQEAKSAIDYLKSNRAGRATFQPVALMRPHVVSSDAKSMLGRRGVVGFANEAVSCEKAVRPVIDSLLGRILIVETLDDALGFAKTSGWSRIVTLEGEVVFSSGAVSGGNSQRAAYGMVQRKADVDSIDLELAKLAKEVDGFETESGQIQVQISKLEQLVTEKIAQIEDAKQATQEAQNWASQVHHELAATKRAIDKLSAELANLSLSEQPEMASIDIGELESKRDAAMREYASLSADSEIATSRIREADLRASRATERKISAGRKLATLLEIEGHRSNKAKNLQPEREKATHEIQAAKKEQAVLSSKRQELERELEAGTIQKRELLEKSFEFTEQAKYARSNSQSINDAMHQAELNRARMESKLATALQRLIEEYSISEEEAEEMVPPDDLPSDASQVVGRLRREIRSMGDVNVGAIEAYERLTSRHFELSEQSKDIEASISDVEAGIKELDRLTRGKFVETFEAVQTAFSEIFQRLFPEGSGQLLLSMPDNLLESGIEIDVQLPGKKKQRLELLSGGERSLCATAFLFALLKVKPSPLVVLDEVDAPLDGRNVEKFIELLRDFAKEIQFIVITHNTSTIAAAPIWLGVTMSEPGVSTLVPVRIPEKNLQSALI